MGIVNRRNALLGWSVWQIGKRAGRRKAKQVVTPQGRRPDKRAAVSSLAAAGGALWFWRRRRGGDETE